jgi:hypothetical protein
MKQFIKMALYLLSITCLWLMSSCEKDLYEEPIIQNQQQLKYDISFIESKEINYLKPEFESRLANRNIGNRGINDTDFELGTVLYDQVMKVVSSNGDKTYMFRVNHPDATYEKFYNMIYQEKIDGKKMIKLFEYNMTSEFADKFYSGEKLMKDFDGSYSYRLVTYDPGSLPEDYNNDGDDGGGGNTGNGTNDGNTGNPTSGNTTGGQNSNSNGVGSLDPCPPCPNGGGSLGDLGSSSSGSSSGSGSSGSGSGSLPSCYVIAYAWLKTPDCASQYIEITYIEVACGPGNRGAEDVDPCPPCNSGNNGVTILQPNSPPPTQTQQDPCEQLKKLGDPTKNNIKPNVDLLKQKVNSNDNNSEIGFESKRNLNFDNTVSYINTNVTSPNQFQVELSTGGNNIGGGHSHPDGSYGMFSFGDVKFLSEAYNNASSTRKEEVFFIVTCKNPVGLVKTYSLKVNDIDALTNNIYAVLNDPKYAYIPDESLKIDAIHYDQSSIYSQSGIDLEKSFLQQFSAFGISLYEATDDTMTHWSKLELDADPANPVKNTPCN